MYRFVTKSVHAASVTMLALLGLVTTVGLSAAKPIIPVFVLKNIDWTSAAIGGVGGGNGFGGTGTITLAGVTGPVKRATLYWMGIDNFTPRTSATQPYPAGAGLGTSQAALLERTQLPAACDGVYGAATIKFNGTPVTGGSTGDATTNCWGDGSSRGYRADVTGLVTGNGAYTVSDMTVDACDDVNGASLIVTFDDGNPLNNRDLVFFEGNDSNIAAGFPGETDGWHGVLPGITYTTGTVNVQLHLGDGQDAFDNSLTFAAGGPPVVIADDATRYDGISTPVAGFSRSPFGSMWDFHTFDISALFSLPGTYTLTMDGQDPANDCLGLIVAIIDLQAGAAPVPVTSTSWGKVKSTYR